MAIPASQKIIKAVASYAGRSYREYNAHRETFNGNENDNFKQWNWGAGKYFLSHKSVHQQCASGNIKWTAFFLMIGFWFEGKERRKL